MWSSSENLQTSHANDSKPTNVDIGTKQFPSTNQKINSSRKVVTQSYAASSAALCCLLAFFAAFAAAAFCFFASARASYTKSVRNQSPTKAKKHKPYPLPPSASPLPPSFSSPPLPPSSSSSQGHHQGQPHVSWPREPPFLVV